MPARRREIDPEARRLLTEAQRLEKQPWPAIQPDYAGTLLLLSIRCETQAGKAELYRWFHRSAGGVLVVRDPNRREALTDALHDAVARSPGLLNRFRAGLDRARRPNLRSMLAAWVHWRAKAIYESIHARHAARRAEPASAEHLAVAESATKRVLVGQIVGLLDPDDHRHRALALVAIGHSITEAARLAGCSRQQIYRARVEVMSKT